MSQRSFTLALWEQNRLRLILLIILALAVVTAFLGRQFFVEPRLESLSSEQFRLQQHVRQRQVEFANSGIPVSTAAQLDKNLQHFMDLIPPQEEFSLFIGDLFKWATEAGLEINTINYNPEIDDETMFLRYELNFSVEGDYAKVKKFVHLLETSKRILMVDKITLAGRSGGKGEGRVVNLNIALRTYFKGGIE